MVDVRSGMDLEVCIVFGIVDRRAVKKQPAFHEPENCDPRRLHSYIPAGMLAGCTAGAGLAAVACGAGRVAGLFSAFESASGLAVSFVNAVSAAFTFLSFDSSSCFSFCKSLTAESSFMGSPLCTYYCREEKTASVVRARH
jgi:hypothetical protein